MRSLMLSLLKSFGVILIYYTCYLFIQSALIAVALIQYSPPSKSPSDVFLGSLSHLAVPLATFLFGASLLLFAGPISKILVEDNPNMQIAPIAAYDLANIGLGITSLCFLYKTIPTFVEAIINLPTATKPQLAISRIVFYLIQLTLIWLIIAKRQRIANWLCADSRRQA